MDWSLYFHIPFCRFACHYCDFVKTARFDADLVRTYLAKLNADLRCWLEHLSVEKGSIKTVFFGGGTPGLFTREYVDLFETFLPYVKRPAEISLEVNPNDVSDDALKVWKGLGFNRVSLGVQTFDPNGLKTLTRDHDALTALRAISNTRNYFENCSIDLIYGWPGQSDRSWNADLNFIHEYQIPHASLYNLTYENGTPMGRAKNAGKITPTEAEIEFERYKFACAYMADIGLGHEEISNWSKPSVSCEHNHRYWNGSHYIGIGVGAHGFLPTDAKLDDASVGYGLRYAYGKNVDKYLKQKFNDYEIDVRDEESWLTEYVACRTRTTQGLSLEELQKKFRAKIDFTNPILKSGMDEGLLAVEGGHLRLAELELFREQAWTLQILQNIKK